jgi:hypothetical protein
MCLARLSIVYVSIVFVEIDIGTCFYVIRDPILYLRTWLFAAPSAVLLRLEYFALKNRPACTYVLLCTMTTGDMLFHPVVEQPQPL